MPDYKTGMLHGAMYKYLVEDGTSLELSFTDEGHVRESWWKIKPGDVVLDIGAAFGSYMIPALALGAFVHAWNPEQYDTSVLLQNLALNGYNDEPTNAMSWRIHRLCVYGQKGFLSAKEDQTFSLTEQEGMWPCMSIDQFVEEQKLERVDWVKMDVEGSEVEAMRGAEDTIKRFKPRFVIENHLFKRSTIENEIKDFIDGLHLGYVSETIPYHAISHSFYTCESSEVGLAIRPELPPSYMPTEAMTPGQSDDVHVLGMSKIDSVEKACVILRDVYRALKPMGRMQFYLDARTLDIYELVISMRDMGYIGVQCSPHENPPWVVRCRAAKGF